MQMQFLHERRRFPSVPTSEPTEACPLAFSGLVHTRTARAISRRRFAYQNGVEFRPRLCDWTHNGLSQKEVLPRLAQRGVLFLPSWVHDVPQERRRAAGTRLTKSEPANR